MHRFFIPPDRLAAVPLELPDDVSRQISRVLRLRSGDRIVVFSGDGEECEATLERVTPESVVARILERRRPEVELPVPLHVAVGLLKGEKPDWVVQKLTELGAARISFLQTERSIVNAAEERWPKRLERYARIAREAAEQCGRVHLPEVRGPLTLAALFADEPAAPALFLDAGATTTLSQALSENAERTLLLIGPEGGFTPAEVEQARAAGALPIRLGRRILRAETAAIAAAALAMAALEES